MTAEEKRSDNVGSICRSSSPILTQFAFIYLRAGTEEVPGATWWAEWIPSRTDQNESRIGNVTETSLTGLSPSTFVNEIHGGPGEEGLEG